MATEIKTLKESAKIVENGCYDSAIVLREIPKGSWIEYVTHLKIYQPGEEPSYAYGHYHLDKKVAEKDYSERCKKYNVAETAA